MLKLDESNEEARLDTFEWEDSNTEGSEHDQSEEESEEGVVEEEEVSESSESNSSRREENTQEVRNKGAPL